MLSFALRCKLSSVLPLVRAQQLRRGQTAIFESIPSAGVSSCGSGAYTWDRVDVGPELTCRPVQLNPPIILAHTHPVGRLSCATAATCAAASTCPATSCTACSAATSLRLRSTAHCDAHHLPATPRVGRPPPARPAARPPSVRPAGALKGGGLLELFELGGRTLGRNGEQRRPRSIWRGRHRAGDPPRPRLGSRGVSLASCLD